MDESTFDIDSAESRLAAKNRFDGNLVHGAKKFHAETNRSGEGRPSSGCLTREHAKVVQDLGNERYRREPDCWEAVDQCPVCQTTDRTFVLSRFGLDIYRCSNCTHRYLHPRIKFDVVVQLYADDKTASDIYTQPLQSDIDKIKYQYGLDLIEQLGPPAKDRIMDIGCGAGGFLKAAEHNGWKRCVGIDANERYNDIYRDDLQGVQYISSTFERLERERLGAGYDCVSMWNVLEHLYDPDAIVEQIKWMLKPGGLVFIMVPNVESLATRLIRERSPTFNWKHVSHFSPSSLNYLMSRHGLDRAHFETAITEIDNIKSYMSGEYPYYGYGDPEGLFDFITPEYIHRNLLGSRLIGIYRNA